MIDDSTDCESTTNTQGNTWLWRQNRLICRHILSTYQSFHLTLWCSLLPYRYSRKASCAVICNFWHSGTLALSSECQEYPDVKNYEWRLNPVCRYRMLYSCTHMATVSIKEWWICNETDVTTMADSLLFISQCETWDMRHVTETGWIDHWWHVTMTTTAVTELLLSAEYVKTRFTDDLTEQLQQHVVVGVLDGALVVDLQWTAGVDLVLLTVHKAATYAPQHQRFIYRSNQSNNSGITSASKSWQLTNHNNADISHAVSTTIGQLHFTESAFLTGTKRSRLVMTFQWTFHDVSELQRFLKQTNQWQQCVTSYCYH